MVAATGNAADLTSIKYALWLMFSLSALITVTIIIVVLYIIKLLNSVTKLVAEVKKSTETFTEKIDPLIQSAITTFEDVKNTAQTMNSVATKIQEATDILNVLINTAKVVAGLIPISRNAKGFFSGLCSVFNVSKKK